MKHFSHPSNRKSVFRGSLKTVLATLLLVLCTSAWAQNSIQGTVTDAGGNPVIGATVVEVDNLHNGTTTDLNGQFTLKVDAGRSIDISFIGLQTQRIKIGGGVSDLKIVMKNDVANIDEVVVVGYGTQKRASVTAAVSQISGKELEKAPTGSISNMLAGRVSGLSSVQQSGQPGADAASILVRGQSVLYIVDGVPRGIDQINPDDIESVSVLKDAAAAAVYGLDGNTVIIVTTKRGHAEKSTITYKGSYGVSQNANKLEMLDGPGYAYWYNRALEMDGRQPVFTRDIVDKMINGQDGWGNTDWYGDLFDLGHNMSHSLSATGGNDRITYYASVGYYDQKGNVDNFSFRRFTARSNISAKIAKSLTLEFGISGRRQENYQPVYSASDADWNNVPQQAMRARPYVPKEIMIDDVLYPTGTPTASATVSPIAAHSRSGYNNQVATYIQPNLSLTWAVPWVEGLKAKFFASYDMTFAHNKLLSTPYSLAKADFMYDDQGYISGLNYTVSDTYCGLGSKNHLQEASSYDYYAVTQTSLMYDRAFGKHHISALALLETRDRKSNNHWGRGYNLPFLNLPELDQADKSDPNRQMGGGSNRSRQVGFVGRVNYNYDNRIFIEVSGRYDGTYLFSGMKGARWGFFPAGSVGWRLSEEKWFKAKWVDNLKLRFGIGLTGTSGVGAYQYLSTMNISDKNSVIIGGAPGLSIWTSGIANPWLTWEKNLTYNVGLDATLWRGRLGLEFDVFYTYKYDMLGGVGGSYPPSMGGFYPTTSNINEQDIKGFDFTISHRNRVGQVNYGVRFMGSYAHRRWLKYAGDPVNAPDYQKLTGKDVGSVYGFIDAGLFQSQEEIDSWPTMVGKDVRPGDIKYIDRNGDGKISLEQDGGYVGTSIYPKFTAGLGFDFDWKGLDINFLFQAGLGGTIALTGQYSSGVMDNTALTKPFYHDGNSPRYLLEDSWTPENPGAFFPRLSLDFNSNNAHSSTHWYRSGDYLRLKTAQIGYTLPKSFTGKIGIQKLRIYLEGSNLFTISHVGKYNIDPEMPSVNNGYYPQQRVISVGLNITL